MNSSSLVSRLDSLAAFGASNVAVDVLRLDLLHPVVSGNKWFKLKKYLSEAGKKTILTFGGAYSNHILATAAAANERGLQSIGIIRGEEPNDYSPTLLQALHNGMKLYFTSRDAYRHKSIPLAVYDNFSFEDLFIIPEGGYGAKGMEGAKDILLNNATGFYTHILSAAGTGTTLAGLTAAANERQQVIGISALKNNFSLTAAIRELLPAEKHHRFTVLYDYHFGGYARQNDELFYFMNLLYKKTAVPTDFVYTAKAFYAAFDLISKGFFKAEDRLLLVHTGGLQGNRSLSKGTLIFE